MLKQCVLTFSLNDLLDNLWYFFCRAFSDDGLSVCSMLGYKQWVFKRHLKRITARSHFNAQMDSCGEVEVIWPQELIYTKGAKQENRLLSQLVIPWLDWLLAYCNSHTEVINPPLHSSKPLWLWVVCLASNAFVCHFPFDSIILSLIAL